MFVWNPLMVRESEIESETDDSQSNTNSGRTSLILKTTLVFIRTVGKNQSPSMVHEFCVDFQQSRENRDE